MDLNSDRAIDTPIEDHGAKIEEEEKPLVSSRPRFKFKVRNQELVNGDEKEEDCKPNASIWICQHCDKEFDSGKGLGGHMRVHKKRASPDSTRKSHLLDLEEQEEELTCLLCPKTFSSLKRLYGHMRLHPNRSYRGMIPPENISAENSPSSTVESEFTSSPGVDLVRGLDVTNWPVKKSRKSKPSTAIDLELNEDEIGAVQALMMLATADIRSAEKKKTKEKVYKCNICSKSYPTPQGLGGHKSSAHKTIECGGLEIANQEAQNAIDGVAAAQVISHICKFCNKAFATGQALGGHMRRHWPGPNGSTSVNGVQDMIKEPEKLGFDLNELPEVDDAGELLN